ncbi:MAG TPA: SAM-dependent chlorinase/fluorinase [Acidimicrobiales bacterium]|nr:SAM-dependent chlorinase/fluorinase [Acidimicrobiales bacterium]
MGRRYDTVTFLSDYGLDDEFVGIVKSVIRDIARHVTVIDLTHGIRPHDVRAGALTLARSVQYVASGVVLAVVDPGVGTERRAVAVEVADGEGVLVGPDNGLLAPAVAMAGGAGRAVVLDNADYQLTAPGATFAGRDVFAPAAAHLCNGVDLAELGDAVDPALLLPGTVPLARHEDGGIAAEVLWVDRFGNAQLNLGAEDVEPWGDRIRLRVGDATRVATVTHSYGDIGPGALGLVIDSYGLLAVSLDRQSAADALGLGAGDAVRLEPLEDDDTPITAPAPLPLPQRRR